MPLVVYQVQPFVLPQWNSFLEVYVDVPRRRDLRRALAKVDLSDVERLSALEAVDVRFRFDADVPRSRRQRVTCWRSGYHKCVRIVGCNREVQGKTAVLVVPEADILELLRIEELLPRFEPSPFGEVAERTVPDVQSW